MTNTDIFRGCGVEVILRAPENFLKVAETLTRIGVPSQDNTRLYQSCHILHKRGKYAILHFKELLSLDGNDTDYSADDAERRNRIVQLLAQWDLVDIVDAQQAEPASAIAKIKIIPHADKGRWTLVAKYQIGRKR